MPDSEPWAFEAPTRGELAEIIRGELDHYELPKSLFHDVKINRLWSHIKRHGSSSAHFALYHGDYELAFHGLTEAEFNEMQDAE